jgi:hypothetical protein
MENQIFEYQIAVYIGIACGAAALPSPGEKVDQNRPSGYFETEVEFGRKRRIR